MNSAPLALVLTREVQFFMFSCVSSGGNFFTVVLAKKYVLMRKPKPLECPSKGGCYSRVWLLVGHVGT